MLLAQVHEELSVRDAEQKRAEAALFGEIVSPRHAARQRSLDKIGDADVDAGTKEPIQALEMALDEDVTRAQVTTLPRP
jgi:hypothetical protein